jgi:hypothetical protein
VAEEVIAKTTGDPAITRVVERFAAMALLGITASVMSGLGFKTPVQAIFKELGKDVQIRFS